MLSLIQETYFFAIPGRLNTLCGSSPGITQPLGDIGNIPCASLLMSSGSNLGLRNLASKKST